VLVLLGLCDCASLGFLGSQFYPALRRFRNMAFAEIYESFEGSEICSARFVDSNERWWKDASVGEYECALRYCGVEDADSCKIGSRRAVSYKLIAETWSAIVMNDDGDARYSRAFTQTSTALACMSWRKPAPHDLSRKHDFDLNFWSSQLRHFDCAFGQEAQ
jgi:hypothetical protein